MAAGTVTTGAADRDCWVFLSNKHRCSRGIECEFIHDYTKLRKKKRKQRKEKAKSKVGGVSILVNADEFNVDAGTPTGGSAVAVGTIRHPWRVRLVDTLRHAE